MKKIFTSSEKLSSIYYINNAPLLTMQSLRKELTLPHKCNIKYFDLNFFFLQIDWVNFDFKNVTIEDFKNNIIFNTLASKQVFLLPVAILINSTLIGYSRFIEILNNNTFDSFKEVADWVNISNSGLLEISRFVCNNPTECIIHHVYSNFNENLLVKELH